jgi:hypothetical protein
LDECLVLAISNLQWWNLLLLNDNNLAITLVVWPFSSSSNDTAEKLMCREQEIITLSKCAIGIDVYSHWYSVQRVRILIFGKNINMLAKYASIMSNRRSPAEMFPLMFIHWYYNVYQFSSEKPHQCKSLCLLCWSCTGLASKHTFLFPFSFT